MDTYQIYITKTLKQFTKKQKLILKEYFSIEHVEGISNEMKQSLTGKLLLYYVLKKRIKGKICYSYTMNMKPKIDNINFEFNISHSNEYVILACVNEKDNYVGVDIECVYRGVEEYFYQKLFHKNEIEYIKQDFTCNRMEKFYKVWTLKEAFLKFTGIGISEIKDVNIFNLRCTESIIMYKKQMQKCYCNTFYLRQGYVVSLCCKRKGNIEILEVYLNDDSDIRNRNEVRK